MFVCVIISMIFYAGIFCEDIHPVRTSPQCNLPESCQIFYCKKIFYRLFCLCLSVYISCIQTVDQILWFNIY